MKPGVSTYAYFWRGLTLLEMLEDVAALGGEVFQICDCPALEQTDECDRRELAAAARRLGVELELGTRGVHPDHLAKYLRYCEELGASLLRTMLTGTSDPAWGLREILPRFERAGVTIALENYEQVRTADLLELVERIDHPRLGLCLDPANSVAALELPEQVVARLAPRVVNLHVKDFVFTRRDGWVGFSFVGCPLGEGLLDLDGLLDALAAGGRDPNAIIELWVPPEAADQEASWLAASFERLLASLSVRSAAFR